MNIPKKIKPETHGSDVFLTKAELKINEIIDYLNGKEIPADIVDQESNSIEREAFFKELKDQLMQGDQSGIYLTEKAKELIKYAEEHIR